MILGWLTFGGIVLVLGILGDRWIAKKGRRPLSRSKPSFTRKETLGLEETDLDAMRRVTDRNNQLEEQNQGNSIWTRLINKVSNHVTSYENRRKK